MAPPALMGASPISSNLLRRHMLRCQQPRMVNQTQTPRPLCPTTKLCSPHLRRRDSHHTSSTDPTFLPYLHEHNKSWSCKGREAMRSGNAATTPPSSLGMGIVPGSSLSLHSRTGSRGGRIRTSAADDAKMLKADYEAGVKQLSVVRRFRNPTLESMTRLKERKIIPSELGTGAPHPADKARPPSRRGHQPPTIVNGILSKPAPTPASRSSNPTSDSENKKPTPTPAGRVHFQAPPQRQASHEGLGVTPSQNSEDGAGPDSDDDGMSVEESMMRRLWQTREVWVREPAVAQA